VDDLYRSRLAGLGVGYELESAYRGLLRHPRCTVPTLAGELGVDVETANRMVDQLAELGLARFEVDVVHVVDPNVGLPALAARVDAELAHRREELEQGRRAIADLVTGLSHSPRSRNLQVADVCWGAHDIRARTRQLTEAASSEVVAMSTSGAALLDGPALPGWCADGVCCRLAFGDRRGAGVSDPVRDRWLRNLADLSGQGAEVRIGPVPTSALIIDSATVALPVSDTASGQTVGLATLRLPSAVTAVVELFERVWAGASPLAEASARESAVTTRERHLLDLLLAGATDQSASYRLEVSVRTVRRIVADLMNRAGARSRFELGARAAERGWLRTPVESR
jgi:DNA-binding CsgD family transcriptional regulator